MCALVTGVQTCALPISVRDALASELDAEFEDLGDCYLRNLSRPVRTYRASPPGYHPKLWPTQRVLSLPTIAVVPFLPYTVGVDHFALGEMLAEVLIVELAHRAAERRGGKECVSTGSA